jgi:hypothetical protein
MEGSCSTGQSPQWAVVPVEEEEDEEEVNCLQQFQMESCQPIKRLRDEKKNV